ncbi:tumor necrosis factor ligand superfamily member 18 [Salminus brasiliensis]|uniref:tumor necrosis factor ligand superfamily member 18 n=1 Tax=Salminus brasiliensis TaxID=930266 RepID=UPI003B831D6E
MSGSGRLCNKLDTTNEDHVAQLRRLIWLLMVWAFFLTLGLAVSIVLHFTLPRQEPSKKTDVTPLSEPPVLFKFDFDDGLKDPNGRTELMWKNGIKKNMTVEVAEDGKYFFYLQVTLQSRKAGVNYTVLVEIFDQKENQYKGKLLTGHINESQLSTGFMGKGFPSPGGRSLKVTCKPGGYLDSENTYVGIIKLG